MNEATPSSPHPQGWLVRLERLGNRLPDPITLFVVGTLLVVILSQIAVWVDWQVTPRVAQVQADGTLAWTDGDTALEATSLLEPDGIFWLLSNAVKNFTGFRPLGVVLVGMLGVGLAERSGLIAAVLRAIGPGIPPGLLTPGTILIGILSSMTLDAGYIVLPPLAMALYRAAGRSPIVGLAAAFAGVAAGFNANLLPTALDPMLAGFSSEAAQLVNPAHEVNPLCNYFFLIASTIVMTATGWFISRRWVEPAFPARADEIGAATSEPLTPGEWRGLFLAGGSLMLFGCVYLLASLIPGAPLEGEGEHFSRWIEVIVPMLMIGFALPGLAYGLATGRIRNDRDIADMLTATMKQMAPIIVLAFFAAQFTSSFEHSGLGLMLATAGGKSLSSAGLPVPVLLVLFILLTMAFNLLMGSMSAKYALFAPVFIPMFMMVGIQPELTQAAYRIGDSVTNIITPLNPYMIIVLAYLREIRKDAGMGSLIAAMLPYTIGFAIVWTIMLLAWVTLGIPLGLN